MASFVRLRSLSSCLTRGVSSGYILGVQRPHHQLNLLRSYHHRSPTKLPLLSFKDSSKPCSTNILYPLCKDFMKQTIVPIHCARTMSSLLTPHYPAVLFTRNVFPVRRCPPVITYMFPSWSRFYSSESKDKGSGFTLGQKNKSIMLYMVALFVLAIGVTYAAVPLYSVFCQATGYGGATKQGHDTTGIEDMKADKRRPLLISFNADTAASMRWNFKPQQREVVVYPGETALAFYSAVNPTEKPIVGISTYNVVPFEAGKYFNKIQCFCFEEQRLNPFEQVDMPVFFFIDPEFAADPKMDKVDNIILSYTFFEAKEGLQLPDPMERR